MDADYKQLERLGVSVKGKIVIARYGQGWRGLKPKLAQAHGAVGCIIYPTRATMAIPRKTLIRKGLRARPPVSSVAPLPT
jgi:N-acetylated-alpha-linked acidic dipeptidase